MKRARLIPLLLFALPLAGCALLEDELAARYPSATVDSARLGSLSFDAVELIADVRIDNPNPIGATLAGFDYDLKLQERSLLAGERDESLRIGAREEGRIDIPLRLTFADVYALLDDLRGRDEVAYSLDLGLHVDVPGLGKRTLPASTSGTLPIPQRPSVSVERLRVDEIGWQRAQVALEMTVDNPNGFGLSLGQLDYGFSVSGQEWASGMQQASVDVPAGGAGRIEVPLSLDFAAIGRSAYQLLLGGDGIDYALSGRLDGSAGHDQLGRFDVDFERSGELAIGR